MFCFSAKQHIASGPFDSAPMTDQTSKAARVLADRLSHAMRQKGETQASLARKSGVAQTTISLYLRPGDRGESSTGQDKGPTLPRIEKLAEALGMNACELLMPEDMHRKFMLFMQFATEFSSRDSPTPESQVSSAGSSQSTNSRKPKAA